MQPEALVEGTSLDGRYRLEEQVGAGDGCTLWRALDTVLSRRVSVRVLDAASPRAGAVLEAAKAASVVGDPRLVRVLDASFSGGVVYVVTEWVEGLSLADLLASGPLEPGEAAYVVGEVADAVATAHQAGVAHLRLHPRNVFRSRTGELRVSGLGVSAALADQGAAADPARQDAHDLGVLLYAALTARWPHGPAFGLPEAPLDEGRPCTPRQVRAGVPGRLDDVVTRAMDGDLRHGGAVLGHPAEVAAALADVPRSAGSHQTMALPMAVPDAQERDATPPQQAYGDGWPGSTAPWSPQGATWPGPEGSGHPPSGPPRPSRATVAARRGLVAVLAIAVLVAVWQVAMEAIRPTQPEDGRDPSAGSKPRTGVVLQPADISDFDPEGDDEAEYPEDAPLALDGDPSTSWQTSEYYGRSDFGGLKSGVGLLVDLGRTARIGRVDVHALGSGTDLEIRAATTPGESQDDYQLLARAEDAIGRTELAARPPVRGRYVLVWLTDLPPEGGDYRGRIAEITVRS